MFDAIEKTGGAELLRRAASLLVSLFFHVALVCIFVLVPLVFLNVLPANDLITILLATPVPPPPLPMPNPPQPETRSRPTPPVNTGYEAPGKIPPGVVPFTDPPPPPVEPSGLQAGIGSAIPSGPVGQGVGPGLSTVGELLPPQPPLPPPPKPKVRIPVPMGGNVQESKLIKRVDPVYPQMARIARVSGTVILQVIVDEEGNVSEVKVLQGNPLLTEEAVRAVSQWKYSPTLLNGEPVPVTATVTVNFTLTHQ